MCALLLSSGCKSDHEEAGDGRASEMVLLEEGTGEENEELLWRLLPGARFGHSMVVLPPVEIDGEIVLPLATNARGPEESHGLPSEPARWAYFSQDDEGNVFFRGQPREGLLKTPALLIPAKVRVGMKWDTSTAGRYEELLAGQDIDYARCVLPSEGLHPGHSCSENNPRFTVEVSDRSVEDTMFGRLPVWTFLITDWRQLDLVGDAYWPDDDITDGKSFTLRLVEGRGPLSSPIFTGDSSFGTIVVPLADSLPTQPLPTLQLEADPTFEAFDGHHLGVSASGYLLPELGSTPVVASTGRGVGYATDGVEGFTVSDWYFPGQDYCTAPNSASTEDCFNGAGIVISADGSTSRTYDYVSGGRPDWAGEVVGMYEGAKNELLGLIRYPVWGYGIRRSPISSEPQWVALEDAQSQDFIPLWPSSVIEDGNQGQLYPKVIDDNLALLAHTQNGFITYAKFDEAMRTTRLDHLAYPAFMDFNVMSLPGERTMLLTTFAGRIEEVETHADGIRLVALGDVDLPDGHFMVGAVRVDDELYVYTQEGFIGLDSWYDRGFFVCDDCKGVDRSHWPILGTTHRWKVALGSVPEGERPSPIWGVTARREGHDMIVCWPPGHPKPDKETWTLGGHVPLRVSSVGDEDRCLLLSRDLMIPDTLALASAWTVEGDLPGYGRVAIGMTGDAAIDDMKEPGCPGQRKSPACVILDEVSGLSDLPSMPQGLISTRGNIARTGYSQLVQSRTFRDELIGAFPWLSTSNGVPPFLFSTTDQGGAGLWGMLEGATSPFLWDGEELRTFEDAGLDIGNLIEWAGVKLRYRGNTSYGGGLLFDTFTLMPDGTQVPHPPEAADLGDTLMRFTDGTLCGELAVSGPFTCVRANGDTETTGARLDLTAWTMGEDGNIYGLGGALSSPRGNKLVVFEPEGFSFSEVDLSTLGITLELGDTLMLHSARGPGGERMAVLSVNRVAYSDHHLLRFGEDGPEVVDAPELSYFAHYDEIHLSLDDEYLLFTGDRPGTASGGVGVLNSVPLLRVPRAQRQGPLPNDPSDCTRADDSSAPGPTNCPTFQVAAMGTDPVFSLIRLLDKDDSEVPLRVLLDDPNGATFYQADELDPFAKYRFVGDVADGPSTVIEVSVANAGYHVDLGGIVPNNAPGTALFIPGVGETLCMPGSRHHEETNTCGFQAAFDPISGRFAASAHGRAVLVEAEESGTLVTDIPHGGVMSPDGELLIGAAGIIDVAGGTSAVIPLDLDLSQPPVFALPEHSRVFVRSNDGSGVVLDWGPDASSPTEIVSTLGADDASFTGDGASVVVREAAGASTFDYARYDLTTGARTLIWTGARLDAWGTNAAGTVLYGVHPTSSLATIVREGESPWLSSVQVLRPAGAPLPFAVNRRGQGAIWFSDEGSFTAQLRRYDEGTDGIVAVASQLYTQLDNLVIRAVGDDYLVISDQQGYSTLDAGDGATLLDFPGEWIFATRNDRKLVLQPDTCGVDPTGCRRLVVLSDDASHVEEEVLDPDNHQLPWPYGFEREGHDDYGQSVYWRHLDPVGLDLPCLLFEGSQMDYRASFDGGALAAVSGLYCY